jgi:hypothetical protein
MHITLPAEQDQMEGKFSTVSRSGALKGAPDRVNAKKSVGI